MNFGCVLLDVATIRIGDDVQVGPNVQFLTPTHPVEAEARRAKWEAAKPTSRGRPGEPAQQLAPPVPTGPGCPSKLPTSSPRAVSHSRTMPSSPPESACRPLGEGERQMRTFLRTLDDAAFQRPFAD